MPVEYAARYRDAFGAPLPPGLADVFLHPTTEPLSEIVRRYARIHGPFTVVDVARRYAWNPPRLNQLCIHCMLRGNCWKESSFPREHTVNGVTLTSCSRFVEKVCRTCGKRFSRSSSKL